jgi:hypothetical protein
VEEKLQEGYIGRALTHVATLQPIGRPMPISREAAHAAGLRRYYTDVRCKRGHLAERYVSNTACVDCYNAPFKLKRNAFSHALHPFRPESLWVANTLPEDERKALERYLQTCIIEYLKHQGFLTDELREAFQMQQSFAR